MSILRLGYVGLRSPDPQGWADFGTSVLGTPLGPAPDNDTVRLRVDRRPFAISIIRGPKAELDYLGWETPDTASVQEVASKFELAGRQMVMPWCAHVPRPRCRQCDHLHRPVQLHSRGICRHPRHIASVAANRDVQRLRWTWARIPAGIRRDAGRRVLRQGIRIFGQRSPRFSHGRPSVRAGSQSDADVVFVHRQPSSRHRGFTGSAGCEPARHRSSDDFRSTSSMISDTLSTKASSAKP